MNALVLIGLPIAFAFAVYAIVARMQRNHRLREAGLAARNLAETRRTHQLQHDIDAARGELARTRLELEAARSELASARQELAAQGTALVERDAELQRLRELDQERRELLRSLADARSECAELRQILVDVEDHAPPPIFGGAHDDLKLIVGVGPVLERLLHKMGVTTFRQIAAWTEHDIDAFDVRLAEFHGRVRRDDWVVQARELHYQKYGERLREAPAEARP